MKHSRNKSSECRKRWRLTYKTELEESASESWIAAHSRSGFPSKTATPANERSGLMSTASQSRERLPKSEHRVLAPGPATDFLYWDSAAYHPKISKAKLLALAFERNIRKGCDATEGLDEFLPKQSQGPLEHHEARIIEKKRKGKGKGFRLVARPRMKYAEKPTAPGSPTLSRAQPVRNPQLSVSTDAQPNAKFQRMSLGELKNYKRSVRAGVATAAEKLNKRCILSREANEIRASTTATVKMFAKEMGRSVGYIPTKRWTLTPPSYGTPLDRSPQRQEELAKLTESLESMLVDKLAAAEIETKNQEREAAYPKLSNSQVQHRLTKLRNNAEATLAPLQPTRLMEVLHVRYRRIR